MCVGSAELTGALPPSLGDLGPEVIFFKVAYTPVTSMPTEIGLLTGLTWLSFSSTQIASIPTEIGLLTNMLTVLSASLPRITSLPSEIGALTSLKWLASEYNGLTSLPTTIGQLTSLTELNLYGNNLLEVPPEFRTISPMMGDGPGICDFANNPSDGSGTFSCANVGAGTSCCTGEFNPDTFTGQGNNCGADLPGGPCYGA